MLPPFFRLIGSDRYLTAAEVERAAEPHPLTAGAWEIYSRELQGFTGASLDPQFHRLAHPAGRVGSIRLEPAAAVLVVGTGPSLATHLGALTALRDRFRVVTSPRGAERLLSHGIVPDLVLVEHQTALDAHHSARHVKDGAGSVLASCPLVGADWRTPAALLTDVPRDALFVPAPLPTWGLWPATAVAMAIEGGASRIAVLGVDLGTAARPDPAHAPLIAVLGLLARLAPVIALDCGPGGAAKRGWLKASLEEAAGSTVRGACDTHLHLAPAAGERLRDARAHLIELAPVLEQARALLAMALEARSSGRASAPALERAIHDVMAWRHDPRLRVLLQEGLGASFLPRLWRVGVDPSLGRALWRPLMLATHELVGQADALAAAMVMKRAA